MFISIIHVTPIQASLVLRVIADNPDPKSSLHVLKHLALSIDGPGSEKERGEGGKSPPMVTLVDVGADDSGDVWQKWGVYADGQKVIVISVTDEDGNTKIQGQDLDLKANGVTAQHAVAFIIHGAHPKYYPSPGKTVTLDDEFLKKASKFLGR